MSHTVEAGATTLAESGTHTHTPSGPTTGAYSPTLAYPPCERKYAVSAIQAPIVFNKFGDHDPNGQMYVLAENEAALLAQVAANPLQLVELVQPLVLRANAGDRIVVEFTNKLSRPASMNPQGVSYDVDTSDGSFAGENKDTTVKPGHTVRYTWQATHEGIFNFCDLGNPLGFEAGSNIHGLWGALVVERAGSCWTDPFSGGELKSGVYADVHHPDFPSFREYVIVFQDEVPVLNRDGQVPVDAHGHPREVFHVNYRSEPGYNRVQAGCPECVGEETALSSWPYGDPATPVPRAYIGDPTKFRIMHAGVKETHGFHLHAHQWRLEPNDPNSNIIDAISIGPQQTFTLDILHGAGSLVGTAGDSIWHCHLYPHFDAGMWGLWRVHDVLEDGTRLYPDGTPIRRLVPLPDRTPPPAPTPAKPGFPFFMPGTFGHKAPKPPLGVEGGRSPTPLEITALPYLGMGTALIDPCPRNAPVKFFDIVAIQVDLIYNRAGWHDPEGRILCLAEDEEAIKSGLKDPEPLVIRANAGDCVHVRFTNKLPSRLGGNPFQSLHTTNECGCHVHLVKFDVLVSDGGANGWNYDSGADPGQTIHYKWYADRELRACFFHDHFFPNLHQQHGYFATLVIEPSLSSYHDPATGQPIRSGAKAIIKNPRMPDFREFAIFHHDFCLVFDKDGNPVNLPPYPDSHQDPGVMAINYRNEPFQFRQGEPAYVFSSYVHGDPYTPLLEAYNGEPIRIRLLHGAHEEQHTFNVNGLKWKFEPDDPHSGHIQGQTITLSEQFDIRLQPGTDPSLEMKDYLYWSGGIDDLWLGMWGIIRIHGKLAPHLFPIEDNLLKPTVAAGPLPRRGLPPMAIDPGWPCPDGCCVRRYEVAAIQKDIPYNKHRDHDPHGLMFVLAEDEEAVLSGRKAPEPLVLRANHGDCFEVLLTNKLPAAIPDHAGDPALPVQAPWPAGNRVSLSPQGLTYWVRGSDGATVGYNPDQTVGPGESILYRWYADNHHGGGVMWSFGDLVNHRHHGLWGAVIVEPHGSTFLDPTSQAEVKSGCAAVIANPYLPDFREFVVFIQDGLNLYDKNNQPVPGNPHLDDPEDQGEKGLNYRSEPFAHRLVGHPENVFSSSIHGDPSTPVFRAYPGDPVVFRLLMASDKPRNHSFVLHGHIWPLEPEDPNSNVISCQGSISIGSAFNLVPIKGAGGVLQLPGDYLYRAGVLLPDLEAGMWGIFRVHRKQEKDLPSLPDITKKAGLGA